MRPDLFQFLEHLKSAEFQIGVDEAKWGVLESDPERLKWPLVYIWVAAERKQNAPDKYYFRFDLNGYPETPPTGCFWNMEKDSMLPVSERPNGKARANSVFLSGFSDSNCLYCPFDRLAQIQHENWKTEYPDIWWRPTFSIVKYLDFIHDLLN